jgi:hypothetical protein
MANPNPQHNPTDGLGTAVAITLTDSAAKMTKVGSQVALSPGNRIGGHQYALTMSVTGVGAEATEKLVGVVVDVKGLTFASGNGNVVKYRVYESPANGANSGKEIVNVTNSAQNPIANSCDMIALNVGQAIVEAYFPSFDTTDGTDFIYSQVILTVTP